MVKAVVLGASGGIGQPLSLLLKASPLIDELSLYDVVNTPGVAADLSHISSPAQITGYLPADDGLEKTLTGADIVVIPAGIPRKPGMTRDDLFKINAGIVRDLVTGIAKFCPKAFILIISNPVNSTVPIAAEILKAHKVFDPSRLFGVTTLDVVRASTFTAQITGEKDSRKIVVPVIGGHSGETIVPLLSLAKPACDIPADKLDGLVHRIQFGGDEVVAAKNGGGSATLSMAFAGFRFAESVIKALKGEKGIVEPTFVYLPGVSGGDEVSKSLGGGIDFFAVPVELGPQGAVKATNPIPTINDNEKKLLEIAIKGLKGNIEKGVEFARAAEPAKL
ncbi:malate dehydrogenase, NAD-dependent [Morchella conica CCBAS932]|uniref:malate dehydrogenase n=2 Tax=Morchella sect. Distantes TaxID=1051054 RepID=A0A3N4KPB2_9PEZI|nr:malate dehydrogenase, NAD-dependent [Morchella conica CCBAS932]